MVYQAGLEQGQEEHEACAEARRADSGALVPLRERRRVVEVVLVEDVGHGLRQRRLLRERKISRRANRRLAGRGRRDLCFTFTDFSVFSKELFFLLASMRCLLHALDASQPG